MTNKLICLKRITKRYTNSLVEEIALKDVSMEINQGEFVAIVGKSGSGKSTLLNMISGIDRPTDGKIYFDNESINELSESKLTSWRGKNIGIVFQFFQLIPTLTVLENILLPMEFCNVYRFNERKQIAMQLLEKTDVLKYANMLPTMLSGGEQQRVAIARSLANNPPLIIADEPTGNLDTGTTKIILKLFESLIAEGKTIIMVTHNEDLANYANRVVTMRDGIVLKDTKGEIKNGNS